MTELFSKYVESVQEALIPIQEIKKGLDAVQLKKGSKKPAQKGDKLGDIVVTLKDSEASQVTKLANKLESLKKQSDKIKEEREKLQGSAEDIDKKYFDAGDLLYSRVLQTGKTMMKFAKIVDKADEKKEETDVAAVKKAFAEIAKLLYEQGVDLSKQLKKIENDTIKIKKIAGKKGVRNLPTTKIDEGIKDVVDKIKQIATNLKTSIQDWIAKFDAKNTDINSKIAKASALI